ncbi:MAG: hypothetical protein JJU02_07325 [Cryomorphaceae bacterium]|nr:hypothetical protein [Cryomorphaceae bacterium]
MFSLTGTAQYVEESEPQNKKSEENNADEKPSPWFYGGNAMFSFGSISTIMLTPKVGYRMTENWVVGGAYTYIYYREARRNSPDLYYTSHGPGLFSMYFFKNPIAPSAGIDLFLSADYDYWFVRQQNIPTRTLEQFLIGGGMVNASGFGPMLTFGVYYDVLHRSGADGSFFPSPWSIRLGIFF